MPAGIPHTLYVSHYGFQQLKGAKHWSLLYFNGKGVCPMAIQVTGSTNTYSVKGPEKIETGKSESYLGKVAVGRITSSAYEHMIEVLQKCPVVHGNLRWNCQDWIIDALESLKSNGYDVETPTKEDLLARLAAVDRTS